MKLAVFNDCRLGVVRQNQVHDVTAALPAHLEAWPELRMSWLIRHWPTLEAEINRLADTTPGVPVESVTLQSVNPAARHVFAAPANYRKHVGELGERSIVKKGRSAREQGFFLKAPASMTGTSGTIVLPKGSSRRFDHEPELAVIIGKGGRNIPRSEGMQHVFGYACLIDATMRIEKDVAEEERSMRKSFATFTPVGPWVVTHDEVSDPENLDIKLWVNDELRQSGNTRELIVGIAELIELISSVLPIEPGDIIATGTPEGVGQFLPGDVVRMEIDGVGALSMPVTEADTVAPRAF